jgi:hypothetical protein
MRLFVPGPLPGMNETIDAAKSGRGKGNAYARLKRSWTGTVCLLARAARLPKCNRVRMRFLWWEPNRRRDPDNIAAARKYVLDGLVLAGVLPNDGWDQISSWTDEFGHGPEEKPGVYVFIDPL